MGRALERLQIFIYAEELVVGIMQREQFDAHFCYSCVLDLTHILHHSELFIQSLSYFTFSGTNTFCILLHQTVPVYNIWFTDDPCYKHTSAHEYVLPVIYHRIISSQ